MKRWIMSSIVLTNGFQFVTSLIEISLFFSCIINDDSDYDGSPLMFYYFNGDQTSSSLMNSKAYVLLICRVLTSDAFFLASCFLLYYFVSTWHTLYGWDTILLRRVKYFIIMLFGIFFCCSLIYSTIDPDLTSIVSLFFGINLIVAVTSVYFSFNVLHWLRSSGPANQKICNRFALIAIIGVLPPITNTVYFGLRLFYRSSFERYLYSLSYQSS